MLWILAALAIGGVVWALDKAGKAGKQAVNAPETAIDPSSGSGFDLKAVVKREAQHNGLRPSLVMAVIDRESRFDPNARGKAGEVGLMQIRQGALDDYNKKNGRNFRLDELFDSTVNVRVGAWYLGWLKKTFSLSDGDTLQAYNGGIGNLLKNNISSDALAYSKDVLSREAKFA